MAISVPIPKEITEYEEKIMFGLSLRKLICFSSAVVLGIGTYFLCTKVFGLTMDTASYIIIVEALPLMALGFIKKDGMPFEQYFALLIRHKTGRNQLSYETELLVDDMPDPVTEPIERKSKYAWIFEKETGAAGTNHKLTRKERKARAAIRECAIFEITKKSRKRKGKETRRTIKAAKQEYRAAKRRAKKAAKKSGSSQKHGAAS
jgi:hypothetical protein